MTDSTELLEARTRRIASDVASLVQRADTGEMRQRLIEDTLANHSRSFATIQAQLDDIARSVRLIARAMDVRIATDDGPPA